MSSTNKNAGKEKDKAKSIKTEVEPGQLIIIHCSDSEFGNAALINDWHQARGWDKIGYHFVILNGYTAAKAGYSSIADGLIETGRVCDDIRGISPEETGAHALGYNQWAYGICLIGKNSVPTAAQKEALKKLLLLISDRIGKITVIGHRDVDSLKTCPNFDVAQFIKTELSGWTNICHG